MVEVMMGCLLLRLPLDESKEKGLFSKAGINNWNRSAKKNLRKWKMQCDAIFDGAMCFLCFKIVLTLLIANK